MNYSTHDMQSKYLCGKHFVTDNIQFTVVSIFHIMNTYISILVDTLSINKEKLKPSSVGIVHIENKRLTVGLNY